MRSLTKALSESIFSPSLISYFTLPDLLTCIVGRFKDGVLQSGRATTVRGMSIDPSTRELSNIYFNPVKPDSPTYSYAPSDLNSIYCPYLQRDPLELSMAYLGPSKISEFAGEGLFAFRDILPGETVAFYNGLRIKVGEVPNVASDSYQVYIDWDLSK
ncbi:SET domain containing (Lysine methyltransferase) 7, partial [Caligus rogercresseyi]